MFQLFAGLVIWWFYRLFHGRHSKTAAYVTVGICTVSVSVFWVVLLVYADWKRGPWYIAYAGGNGYSDNVLPENFPLSTRRHTLPYTAAWS